MYRYLDNTDAARVRGMTDGELTALAAETRDFIINALAGTGGHLAANLGVAELTCALLAEFEPPRDKIIWDVGHQCYVYKLLTGRRGDFGTLRGRGGISGFPKPGESDYDAFGTGHSSTAVSAALGLAKARDIIGGDEHVVAVVGDGAMTGGLAYEGLNNAGRSDTRLIVILNDNQMSISENVGALSRYLNEIRTDPAYIYAKEDVSNFLSRIPVVGPALKRLAERTKGGIKHLLVPGSIFEELGFNYIGPIDGHNLRQLLGVLRKAKQMPGPVLLHVYTQKGKGYEQAEEAPSSFHGVDSFHIDTGEPVVTKLWETYSDVFGKTMSRLSSSMPGLAAVSAAMTEGVGLTEFARKHPDRMFDVGIAEGHAVTFAAGLAKGGLIPVVAVYSSFLQRAYDQILHDVCLQSLHVVFAIDRAGVVGADGETHQGLYDLAYLSHIPNMAIMAPSSKKEMILMLELALGHTGPVAIRYPKGPAPAPCRPLEKPVRLGVSETAAFGFELAFVALGPMVDIALEAASILRKQGHDPAVVNARFVKPLDLDMVRGLSKLKAVFSLEDHALAGGFGSILLSAMEAEGVKPDVFRAFGFPDKFIEQGTRAEIFKAYGLDADSVARRALEALKGAPAKAEGMV
jgi:1-deoxy-D-xylulose-5-phosphate synthase